MAVKFFGTCSGSSGSKYDIWAEVNENSHSIKNNTSNLTVKLKLKRNDGYASSAFNLNKSENFAKITIDGSTKASGNLEIDTRNSAVVTLCSWTGDILHDSSGKLTVTVGATFTMGLTSLTGGSVSGKFNCVTIPRVTPFSLNKSSVNCGDSLSLSLSPYSSEFSHKVVYSINKVNQTISIAKGTTQVDLTVPKEWANQLLNSNQGVINFELKTYSGSELIGSTSKNIKILIPATDDFLPDYTYYIKKNKNGVVPGIWDALVQNISTIEITINSFQGKFGATCSTNCIMLDNVKKYTESAVFELTKPGKLKLKIRVTDSRGLYREKETLINVDEYSLPGLICNNIFRCDSDGKPNDNGTNILIDFTKKYSSIRGLNAAYVKVKYRKNSETGYSSLIQLGSTPFILSGNFERESSYDLVFEITDMLTKTPVETTRTLPSGEIPFNIKKGGKGAAFGCYAETDNELTVGYNLNIKGNIKSVDLSTSCIPENNVNVDYISLKKYDCLDLTFFKCHVTTKEAIPANNWIKILTLPIGGSFEYTPINIISFKMARDKNLMGAINQSGEIFISSDVMFDKNESIYITSCL